MIETVVYLSTALLVIAAPLAYWVHYRRSSRKAQQTLAKAIERGLDEPVSLHPIIDPGICIGSGACVKACPELTVLGIIEGKGQLVSPSRCIGHGQCEAACPVGAITLVFGTEKRGVDIPHVRGNYETNVPGVYIAGELGGMGLIRNAVNQGVQAARAIAESLNERRDRQSLDLIIVGSGPAGFAASLQALESRLNFMTLDQEDIGGTVITYPRKKLVMTQPMVLPLHGKVNFKQVEKEVLADLFLTVAEKNALAVNSFEKVNDVSGQFGGFNIATSKGNYSAKSVLLAIGRRGSPRKIGCPGEKSGKVAYRLLEPEKFHDMSILVVGGGDSAVEAALALAEQPGNKVSLSYRGEQIFRIKELNQQRLDAALQRGDLTPYFNSNVTEIEPERVKITQGDQVIDLPNDYIFVFIGGELPTEFLKKIGIEFTRKFGTK